MPTEPEKPSTPPVVAKPPEPIPTPPPVLKKKTPTKAELQAKMGPLHEQLEVAKRAVVDKGLEIDALIQKINNAPE